MIRLLWAYILRVTKNKGSEAAVRHRIALILALTVVVLFGVLFGSVRAAAAVAYVDVYTGVWDQSWEYTQGPHSSLVGSNTAHDVVSANASAGPLVHFSPNPSTATAYVSDVGLSCDLSGGAGTYVRLSVWDSGLYYGEVLYQHITNVQVSRYNYYPAGTTLGSILTNGTVSSCWSGPHVHYEAEGNRPTYPSYWQHQYDDAHDVPTYVWYPYSDWLVRLYN